VGFLWYLFFDAIHHRGQLSTYIRRVRSLKIRSEDARRARVILMPADGESYSTIEAVVPCYRDYINRWWRRFLADGLDGLRARYRGQRPRVLTPALEARIMTWTRRPPPHGATPWFTRSLGRTLGVQHTIIARACAPSPYTARGSDGVT